MSHEEKICLGFHVLLIGGKLNPAGSQTQFIIYLCPDLYISPLFREDTKPPRIIKIFYHSETNDPQHHISLQDNGIGIEKSVFSSIFEPFQLADAAKLSRRYDRIGLSLSIAKKVVQMHSGDISVDSTVNTGSTFTIHIPKEIKDAS